MPPPGNAAAGRGRPSTALVLLAYLGFVSLGLPDTVLGVAWPSLRETFTLPQAALGVPLAVSAATYFASGVLAGRLVRLLGTGGLLAASTAVVAAGAAAYAAAPSFAVFLAAACVVGAGSGAVDSALNAYAAHRLGARHMTWLHAAYSTGAAIGPATMAALVASGAGWRTGYVAVAAALAALTSAFVATRRRWADGDAEDAGLPGDVGMPRERARALGGGEALRRPHVPLQIAIFFLYSGTEVAAGQWSYTVLVEARGLDAPAAGAWATAYWASLLAGRVVLGFVVERVGTVRLVRLATAAALAGATAFAVPGVPTVAGSAGLCLLGFALAPVYPGLMSETPRRVGAAAVHAIGFQVAAATAGVAVIPGAAGVLGEKLGLAAIPAAVAACALVLAALHERLVATADRAR
jgi:fucose permease